MIFAPCAAFRRRFFLSGRHNPGFLRPVLHAAGAFLFPEKGRSWICAPSTTCRSAFFSGKSAILDFCALFNMPQVFVSQKSAILDFCSLCNMPQFFLLKKGEPGFLRPLQHAAGAFFPRKSAILADPGFFEHVISKEITDLVRDSPL